MAAEQVSIGHSIQSLRLLNERQEGGDSNSGSFDRHALRRAYLRRQQDEQDVHASNFGHHRQDLDMLLTCCDIWSAA